MPLLVSISQRSSDLLSACIQNCRKNPIGEFAYDGTSTHPYETMFVVMDTVAIENGWSFAKLAALYETWLMLQVMAFAFVGPAAA